MTAQESMMQAWVDRLDMLGSGASRDALKAHLVCCPAPESAEANYLREHLAETA